MPITVTCPNCREELDIPNELVGGQVRCGSCLEVFVATAPPGTDVPPPLPDEDRPRRPRRKGTEVSRNKSVPTSRPDDGYGPVEFDPDRKRKQGVGATLWIVLGVFGLLGCTCCGGFLYFFFKMAQPEYKAFKDPDGRFVAQFPAEVKEKTRDTGVKGGPVRSFEAARPLMQETFFVYAVELTAKEKQNPADGLKKVADGLKAANKATEMSRTDRTHQGYDAVDLVVKMGRNRFIQARIIVAEERAYVVGVSTNDPPDDRVWLEHYFESFEIVAPAAKPADKKPEKKGDD